MESNKLSIGIVPIVLLVFGAFALWSGISENSTGWTIAGIIIVILAGAIVWFKVSIYRYSNKPIDERATDPIYVELRNFLRETLLPFGFNEKQEEMLGFHAEFSRDELWASVGVDFRDQEYYFALSGISETHQRNFSIRSNATEPEKDEFKAQVRQKLQDWLKELNI